MLVVVDGEDDGTGAVVREAGHYACIAPVNRGQGAALRLGYRIAREHGARFIVTSDADGQTDPDDLEVVLEPVVSGRADFVNGSRRLGQSHGTDAVRNTGVLFFAALISFLTRTPVTDTANPVRAFRAELPAELDPRGTPVPGSRAAHRGHHARMPLRGAARDDAGPPGRRVEEEREPPLRPPLRPRSPAHLAQRAQAAHLSAHSCLRLVSAQARSSAGGAGDTRVPDGRCSFAAGHAPPTEREQRHQHDDRARSADERDPGMQSEESSRHERRQRGRARLARRAGTLGTPELAARNAVGELRRQAPDLPPPP